MMLLESAKVLLTVYTPVFGFLLLQEPIGTVAAALIFGPMLMVTICLYGSTK